MMQSLKLLQVFVGFVMFSLLKHEDTKSCDAFCITLDSPGIY